MNRRRLSVVMVLVILALVAFISCNSEIDASQKLANVSFAPSVSKALNQSGSVVDYSQDVNSYSWKYYCSTKAPTNITDTDWKEFTDASTGLGTIKDLLKGDSYYFGLQGYSTDTNQLIWEGFHYGTDGKTAERVTLSSKNQIITIDVYPKGLGNLYFSISAPCGFSANIDPTTKEIATGCKADRFVFTYESLDGKTTGSDYLTNTSYNSETDYFSYADLPGKPVKLLPAGTYLFTVKQQTWDSEARETAESPLGCFVDVLERSQILIINIVSGVDTVIAGTLDSTGLIPFEYYGYSTNDYQGIQMAWHDESDKVAPLSVLIEDKNGNAKYVYNHDRVRVNEDDFVQIYTSVLDASQLKLFVNGEEVSTKTDANNFYTLPSEEECYIKAGDKGSSFESIKAYSKDGFDYLITLTYHDESMTFTILGSPLLRSEGVYLEGDEKVEFNKISDQHIKVSAEMPGDGASILLNQMIAGNATSETDNKLTLTLSVLEQNRTESFVNLNIDMKALAEVFTNGQRTFASETDVKSVESYVIAKIELGSDYRDVEAQHDGHDMVHWTTSNDILDAPDSDDNGYGFYLYDSESGILYLKTKTFSPFRIGYTLPNYYKVNFYRAPSITPIHTEKILEGKKVEKLVITNNEGNHAQWRTSWSDTYEVFDFSQPITKDTEIYAVWYKPTFTIKVNNEDYTSFTNNYEDPISYDDIPVKDGKIITSLKDENNEDWDLDEDLATEDTILYATIADALRVDFYSTAKYKGNIITCTDIGAGSKIVYSDDYENNNIKLSVGLRNIELVTASGKDLYGIFVVGTNSELSQVITSKGSSSSIINVPVNVTYKYSCKVTFEANNGTSATNTEVPNGSQVTQPVDPVNGQLVFTGWYKDSAYTSPFDFSTSLSDDLKLYAGWKLPYDLTVSSSTTTIVKDFDEQLSYTISPTNLQNYTLTWASNNTSIATVDQTAKVVGTGVGNVKISATLTTSIGSLTESIDMTVITGTDLTLALYEDSSNTYNVGVGKSPRWKDILARGVVSGSAFTTDSNNNIIYKYGGSDNGATNGWKVFSVYTDSKYKTAAKYSDTVTNNQTLYLKLKSMKLELMRTPSVETGFTYYLNFDGSTLNDLLEKSFTVGNKTYTFKSWYDYKDNSDLTAMNGENCFVSVSSGSENYLLFRVENSIAHTKAETSFAINHSNGYKMFKAVEVKIKCTNYWYPYFQYGQWRWYSDTITLYLIEGGLVTYQKGAYLELSNNYIYNTVQGGNLIDGINWYIWAKDGNETTLSSIEPSANVTSSESSFSVSYRVNGNITATIN